MCTEGLSGTLSEEDIKQITLNNELNSVPNLLIKKAIENKSSDNITVTVISF